MILVVQGVVELLRPMWSRFTIDAKPTQSSQDVRVPARLVLMNAIEISNRSRNNTQQTPKALENVEATTNISQHLTNNSCFREKVATPIFRCAGLKPVGIFETLIWDEKSRKVHEKRAGESTLHDQQVDKQAFYGEQFETLKEEDKAILTLIGDVQHHICLLTENTAQGKNLKKNVRTVPRFSMNK